MAPVIAPAWSDATNTTLYFPFLLRTEHCASAIGRNCGFGRFRSASPDPTQVQSLHAHSHQHQHCDRCRFKTFGKAVETAGMSDTLRGPGPFTIFAPTGAAFEKLPAGTLENLLEPENKQEPISLLNCHVVPGRRSAADVGKWESARTADGQVLPGKMTGDKVSIDGAQIASANTGSSNGVIHGSDKVGILPARCRPGSKS